MTTEDIEHGWREHTPAGLMTMLGPLLSKKNHEGNFLYGLTMRQHHLNPAGIVHGGTITTLMDHVFSTVGWTATEKRPCVTVQLNVNFLGPAYEGDLLVVHSTINRQTGSLLFINGETHVDGNIIATGQAVLKVLKPARSNV